METETRFGTLNGVGKFISALGVFLIFLAIGGGFIIMKNTWGGSSSVGIGVLIGGAIMGILVIANGQLIQCFVAIEENTRQTSLDLRELKRSGIDSVSDKPQSDSIRALEEVLDGWRSGQALTLNSAEKRMLRDLVDRLRPDLTREDWLNIARLIKHDPHSELSQYYA
jgi:hypothetical protein